MQHWCVLMEGISINVIVVDLNITLPEKPRSDWRICFYIFTALCLFFLSCPEMLSTSQGRPLSLNTHHPSHCAIYSSRLFVLFFFLPLKMMCRVYEWWRLCPKELISIHFLWVVMLWQMYADMNNTSGAQLASFYVVKVRVSMAQRNNCVCVWVLVLADALWEVKLSRWLQHKKVFEAINCERFDNLINSNGFFRLLDFKWLHKHDLFIERDFLLKAKDVI